MQYTQVRLLKYMMDSAVHLMANVVHQVRFLNYMMAYAYAVHLLENAAHPSGSPDAHDGICSTLEGKCSNPSEAPVVRDGKCC